MARPTAQPTPSAHSPGTVSCEMRVQGLEIRFCLKTTPQPVPSAHSPGTVSYEMIHQGLVFRGYLGPTAERQTPAAAPQARVQSTADDAVGAAGILEV